jgi:aryl-alcohol dehydrogenase-like predicted oxidoreductase
MNNRLALGTAQFGSNYGVKKEGMVSNREINHILHFAASVGIDTLDTAIAYGEAEQNLGHIGIGRFKVISKLPNLRGRSISVDRVVSYVAGSLDRLRVDRLYGLLLHSSGDLQGQGGSNLYAGLQACKEFGLVEKVGVSIYDPSELNSIVPQWPMDLIQGPFSIFDRRLEDSGWLKLLHQSGVEIFARSVFLQGLLLMDFGRRPTKFERWNHLWRQWHQWLDKEKLSALSACLEFVFRRPEIDKVIVGVNSRSQLQEIVESLKTERQLTFPSFEVTDCDLVNPSRWESL